MTLAKATLSSCRILYANMALASANATHKTM